MKAAKWAMMDVYAEAGAQFFKLDGCDLLNNLFSMSFEQFTFPASEQFDNQRWMGPGFQDEALGYQLVYFVLDNTTVGGGWVSV